MVTNSEKKIKHKLPLPPVSHRQRQQLTVTPLYKRSHSAKRRDHITHVLQQLYWLPVWRRIEFKIACLVHQSLSGRTPMYLAADIQLAVDRGRQNLRSATDRTCFLPRTHKHFRWQEFFCRWTSCVELFTCRSTTWDAIQGIQATTQNSTV